MKRDKTGKFIRAWDEEPKQAVKVSLTKTAWQILQQQARERGMSRSELIEHYARSLQSVSTEPSAVDESIREAWRSPGTATEFQPATETQEPANFEIEAWVASRANTPLQEQVVKLKQELQQQTELQANQRQWLQAILNLLPTPLILIDPEAKRVTFSNQAANKLAGSDISTDRKRAEQEIQTLNRELQQRVTELQTLLDVIPVGIAIADDPQCQVVRVNPFFQRMFQVAATDNVSVTSEDAVPLPFKYFQNGRELSGEELPMDLAAASGIPIRNCELQLVRSDGVRIDLLGHAIPLFDEPGVVRGCVGVYMDITERKQAEEALRQSEACFRTLLDNIPDTIVLYDAQQRVKFLNAKGVQLVSRPLEEILGRTDRELWPPEVTNSYLPLLHQAVETRTTRSQECTITLPTLDPLTLIVTYIPLLDEQGDIKEILGITYDITERKRSEAALEQSEARLARMAENVPGVIFQYRQTLHGNDEFTYISSGCLELYGVESWEFQQNSQLVWQAIHPDDLEAIQKTFTREVVAGAPWRHEWRIIDRSGELKWLQGFARCEREADGSLLWDGVLLDISDRKRAEVVLQESEERYRRLFENNPQPMWMFDAQTLSFLAVNEAAVRHYGYSQAEFLAMTVRDIRPAEDIPALLNKLAKTPDPLDYAGTWRHLKKDGSVIEVEITSHTETFAGRDAYLVLINDVTKRKRIERALQQSEERFRTLADNIAQLAWMADENGLIFWYNQRWFDYTGATFEEMKGWGWQKVHHPEHVKQVVQKYRHCIETGDTWEDTFPLRSKDGQYRWFLSRAIPLRDRQGKVFRWFGTNTDITERKHAEAALRQSEERYRYLAELIPQLVWIANDEGVLLDVNQRWLEFTGLTPAQAQTEGWSAVVHPDDLPVLSRQWGEAQQNAIGYQAEGRMRRADGVYRWHLHQALPLKNEQGQVVKWFGTATDIDDQKQLEQQRDREAVERHRILQQEQRAREEAERANRIKDEFLAVLSHELRSPLNPILGWSRLLQTRKFNEAKTNEALQIIERNAKLQAELIEDLLDVSRILRGKLSLNIAPVDLASTIHAAMETVQLAAQAKSIQIQTRLEPNVGKVAGDSSRLQQVVWNILSNAVKFTPKGGQVSIRVERLGSHAQITISDTGKGISPEFLPHVFDYFRQADSTSTRTFGGLGLGLAIVHHLVELHGGSVQADSPGEGQGATFTVKLPLMPTQPETNQDDRQLEQSLNLNGIKVLVVDDDADSREFVSFVLEQEGATVTMASSAREALTALIECQPDVLLSDIGMPNIDGYMLIQQVRALPPEQGGRIKAIALTAYAGEINYQQALAAGFQQHLSKPVEPDELVATIANLIHSLPRRTHS